MEILKRKNTIDFRSSLLATLLSITVAFGQSNSFSQKYGSEEDYRRLYFLNVQYIQSYVKSDTATYNRLLWAEDWTQQNSGDGKLYSKKQSLPLFGTPRFEKIEYFYADKVSIQFITNDAAMIFAETPLRLKGESITHKSQYNDIYIKRNGQWKCVSANITKIKRSDDQPAKFVKLAEPPPLISYVQGSETDKKKLTELNDRHAEGFATSHSNLLENILADDYILLAGNGMLYKKNEVLGQLNTAAKSNEKIKYAIENLNIRFVAADIAFVHAAFVTTLQDGTKTGTQYNDVYVKRNNAWVCVSGNNTPISN